MSFSPHLPPTVRCSHCRHSEQRPDLHMWCALIRRVVVRPCGSFEREPGADDELE